MTRAAKIIRLTRAAKRAERRADLAMRKAFAASNDLKWASVCSPSTGTLECVLGRAVKVYQNAIDAVSRKEAADAALAAAWRGEKENGHECRDGSGFAKNSNASETY